MNKTYLQEVCEELDVIEEKETPAFFAKKCVCGAVTVDSYGAKRGESWSMGENLFNEKFDLKLEEGVYSNCNHCVNHWGIDLCDCGSGESPSNCECGSGLAMQNLGEAQEIGLWA